MMMSELKDKYKIHYTVNYRREINNWEYGYIRASEGQLFYATADGWEVICGFKINVAVRRLIQKSETEKTKDELQKELKKAESRVKYLKKKIKDHFGRFELMDFE